jgi:hypothetical protein
MRKPRKTKKPTRPAHWEAIEASLRQEKLEQTPSIVTHCYWVLEDKEFSTYPKPTERSGKWLIFVSRNDVDEVWHKIKIALEKGELGETAKVSTAKPNPNSKNPSTHVICVFTYDSEDKADVRRVRKSLRRLGVFNKISYKTDSATFGGKYAKSGSKKTSLYHE